MVRVHQQRAHDLNMDFLGSVYHQILFAFPMDSNEYTFNGGYVLTKVKLRDGESQDKLMRRFRKAVIRGKVLGEVRKRRWFISKSEQKRMDKKKAIRRYKKRARTSQGYD